MFPNLSLPKRPLCCTAGAYGRSTCIWLTPLLRTSLYLKLIVPPDPPPLPYSGSPLFTPASRLSQSTVPAPYMGQGQQAHKLALNWDTHGPTLSKWPDGWEYFSVLPFTQVVRVADSLDTTSPINVVFPPKHCHGMKYGKVVDHLPWCLEWPPNGTYGGPILEVGSWVA